LDDDGPVERESSVLRILRLSLALLLLLLPGLAAAADDPLVRAAAAGDSATIRALLKQGHDVNATGPDGATALHWAVRADDLATVDALIRAGAKVGVANALGVQPVYVAAQNGNAAMLTRLLDAKADVNATDAAGDTLLMAAVRAESAEAVRLLLDRGASVNAADPDVKQTALMWAARVNNAGIMRALLAAGATVDVATRASAKLAARPPGAGGGSHGVGIVRSGVPPQGEQAPANGGMTPLLFAARDGLLDAAKLLVEAGANLNTADPNGITPLLMAITNGQLPVARWLVERGADVKGADWYGRTPIWAAVEVRNLDLRSSASNPADNGVDREAALGLIAALIDKGADVNARVKEFPPARRYMLPLGSLEWVDITGQTAFTRAAQSADIEAMRLLLAKGADPKITTFNGTNALMMAAGVNWVISQTYGSRWLEATELCLDLGFDVNAVNQMGLAAVHGAANRGSDDVIELLAKRGARLDVKDKEGRTPATWAEGVFLATNSPIAKPSTIALITRLTKQ
jgi:ankyrin